MIKIKAGIIGSLLLFVSTTINAHIRLPAIIGSNMVLQQQSLVSLWGWGDPGEKVRVTNSWNKNIDSAVANSDGKWIVRVTTGAAGGPHTVRLQAGNTLVLENVLLGEVWLCSGQSNMEWNAYTNNKQALEEAPNATNKEIRFFHIPRATADYPQDDCRGSWKVCTPEDMKQFSIIGYFFGKKLNAELGVPMGLIESAWGGTPAEVWTAADVIAGDDTLKQAAAKLVETPWGPSRPGKTFNAMIHPITNFNIAGTLWYQGEANVGTASSYKKLLDAMIRSWRSKWQKEFPFYLVQIAPFDYGPGNSGALLREAQSKLELNKTGMIVISDLVDDVKDIHPKNKKDVAIRLADLALADIYNKKSGPHLYPTYQSMRIEKASIVVELKNAPNGLITKNGEAHGFMIAGEDKVFHPAKARFERNTVILTSAKVSKPVAARFGFTNTSMPNVFSKEGLPMDLFRTDDW